ncbi:PAS domain S-box-containing protein [Saccharicrinis carchari]|uniref:PAS domain S-box-containing protein n=1 Tax=Saccharicrinis carchari TaxID=1168039 RepID=A0A521F3S2_SACCC|nr:CHASE domain-containing protein [Saccharicrinis carchari]SMO90823.1 PAS domain S-box-containing protein [Saccharicrinis carchari]
MSREDWKNFNGHYNLDLNLPGILGIGFSLKIPKDKLNEHIRQIRDEGYPEYVVWPEYGREIYTSNVFIEPFSGKNLQAFGYDMMTEPVRKEAMERARDMDLAALSGKVRLVQENGSDVQAGNLIYVPVYQKGLAINTVEQRRAALKGWVYSPCRMNDLISGILRNWELEDNLHIYYLHIYDGLIRSSESLLFESHYPDEQKIAEKDRFTLDLPIDFNGHRWTLVFTQREGGIFIDYLGAWGLLVGGFIISILLFLLTRSLINTRYNAQKIAEKLTVELKESENRPRTIMEASPVPMILSKMDNMEVIIANETFGKLFKISVSETIGQKLPYFYHNEKDQISLLRAVRTMGFVDNYELLLKKSDGGPFWCSMSLKLLTLDGEQVLITAFHDITERKKAEVEIIKYRGHLEEMVAERTRELTVSEQKLQQSLKEISDYKLALDETSLVAITDSKGIIMHANDTFCKVSKFSRDELVGNTHRIINSGFHSRDFLLTFGTQFPKARSGGGRLRIKPRMAVIIG